MDEFAGEGFSAAAVSGEFECAALGHDWPDGEVHDDEAAGGDSRGGPSLSSS